jgi:aryl-alcohol dehydrogenase-like predicted oxidoreductase
MAGTLSTSKLGDTGLEVTRLGYGAMAVGNVTDHVAELVLNAVLDSGINFIDTSIDYGSSEEFIGKYISRRRSEYFIASKCGCPVITDPKDGHIYTGENIVAGVNQSLARMKTDYLDFVQFHGSPGQDIIEDNGAIDTLMELREEGKIRFLGSSSVLPSINDHINMDVFDEFQIPYSALDREHEEVISRSADAGIGTVIRGGVAQGEPGMGRGKTEIWDKFSAAGLDELRGEGESRSAFILRFTLSHPDIHTIIAGTKNLDHLNENIEAVQKGALDVKTYSEAKNRL